MPGRFERMSDAEWELVEDIFPDKVKKSRGMPAANPRKVLNSPLFFSVTGCRWCDLPRGGQECWLKTWHSDGRLKELRRGFLELRRIFWKSGSVDDSFPCGKGIFLLTLMEYRYRHVHLQQIKIKGSMLEMVAVKTGKAGR